MMDRFMVRGSHGLMQWMLDLRTYGLKIRYNTMSRGHIEWTGGRRLLTEELMFGNSKAAEPIPSVPWESKRDNPTNERPGWNFCRTSGHGCP
jgi:hypothetical protein